MAPAKISRFRSWRISCSAFEDEAILHERNREVFNGTCENLSIPLMEDRLVLEGGAAVTIQKNATNVSSTRPAAFELKGETLNLRISELPSNAFMQTSMRKTSSDLNVQQTS